MSLTVGELIHNHVRGINSDYHVNKGEYFDTEIPHFNDITEQVEYKRNLKEQYNHILDTEKKQQAEAQKIKLEAARKKAAEGVPPPPINEQSE
jgi:hypothetical protein